MQGPIASEPNGEWLGPPTLSLAGFHLWVHGREFPDAQDRWDGNWLRVSVLCEAPGCRVWTSGPLLMVSDLADWLEKCESLYQKGQGEADLQPLEPNLVVRLCSSDRMGHVMMRVEITPDHLNQTHRVDFEIDQTYLPKLMAQCRGIFKEYPVRS
ncbi:MAG: hypothetical protein ACKO23_16160 [Gemmataceae bacterium]